MDPKYNPFYLKLSDAIDAAGKAQGRLDSINFDFNEKRIQFFEKLALLNGGALASSATVLAYFAPNHGPVHTRLVLESAWIVLLVAMAAALSRNFLAPRVAWHEAHEIYTRKKREVELAEVDFSTNIREPIRDRHSAEILDPAEEVRVHQSNAEKWQEASKQALKRAKRFRRLMLASQLVSLTFSFIGLALLVVFALANMK